MGTLIGAIIGVAATIIVARYYFRRSTNKRISVFVTLNNRIFSGIEKDVRKNWTFTTRERKSMNYNKLI